ncbi:DUF423 domain-containing protein [Inquilinus sp. CAU 1745]|uniref:DUF423 domain-containing protein n=1 Tax=Inquilinus sp. CAU 1745 TaxID=3140369 RepID=UPI00325AADCD
MRRADDDTARGRRPALLAAGLHGALAVGFGAFAAHGAGPDAVALLETGGQYQLVHAVALLALAPAGFATLWRQIAILCFILGPLIFAGALYGLAFGAPGILGAVAPIGGTLMILGWLAVAAGAWRAR